MDAETTPLTPEELIEHLRALRARISEFSPLTPEQRRALIPHSRMSEAVLNTSINVIGEGETVAQALGHGRDEVRQMVKEAARWTTVEDELRAMWNGVSGANVLRRRRIEFLAAQAASISSRLAVDPAHATLVPYVQEIRRLRSFARRGKAKQPEPEAPGTPDDPPFTP